MLWRTLALSAVNAVTVLMVFVPVAGVVLSRIEVDLYLHGEGLAPFFFIQVGLGIFAVVIDMLNKRPSLQLKLLVTAVVLSIVEAVVILWLVSNDAHYGDAATGHSFKTGAFLPLINVVLFLLVWFDQRRTMKNAGRN